MSNELFYTKCAELLGIQYECQPFPWTHSPRTRWNNRAAGSGRYPGFGTIRKFGDQIHVSLRNPIMHTAVYDSEEAVLDLLRSLK